MFLKVREISPTGEDKSMVGRICGMVWHKNSDM